MDVAIGSTLPAIVTLAVGARSTGTTPHLDRRVVVLVDGSCGPVRVVVRVVVAIRSRHVRAVQRVMRQAAMARVWDSLVRVHGGGVGPERMHSVVAEHAAPSGHEVITSAVRAIEAIGLEIVGMHEPVTLLDVIRVTESGVAGGSGTIVVMTHVTLVDVGAHDVVDVGVTEVMEVVVDLRASVVLEVLPIAVAVGAVVLPVPIPRVQGTSSCVRTFPQFSPAKHKKARCENTGQCLPEPKNTTKHTGQVPHNALAASLLASAIATNGVASGVPGIRAEGRRCSTSVVTAVGSVTVGDANLGGTEVDVKLLEVNDVLEHPTCLCPTERHRQPCVCLSPKPLTQRITHKQPSPHMFPSRVGPTLKTQGPMPLAVRARARTPYLGGFGQIPQLHAPE